MTESNDEKKRTYPCTCGAERSVGGEGMCICCGGCGQVAHEDCCMSGQSMQSCAACGELRNCRLVDAEYEVRPSIHEYDPAPARLVKDQLFFCYHCK